jgi:predicted amidohydrolase YtcJ
MHWSCAFLARETDRRFMLVIHNSNLLTFDPHRPSATAIAIDLGRVKAIGTDDEILSSFASARKLDADGFTIIPGLIDAHIHLEDYALSLQKVDCETLTRKECLQRVAARAITASPGEWILGHGWNQNNWAEGYGTASLLDDISPNNPVYLTHKSLHCAWANSIALHMAGISRETTDPDGGLISRFPHGEPDGILFESAMGILDQVIPSPGFEQVVNAIQKAIPLLWQLGLTGVHDFDGSRCFSALQLLHNRDLLKLRVLKGIHLEDLTHAIEVGLRSGFGDDFLRIGPLKLFADGALGPHTAAMLTPYEDDHTNCGILMLDAEAVFEHGKLAIEHDINLAIHAIGDRANHEVLAGYAKLRQYERTLPTALHHATRHRIEHVQVIDPADLPQFSKLNLIASMQPIHATSDMLMADRFWGVRSARAYAWRSLITSLAPLAFGSDAPVESPNPFWGVHAAVTRRRSDGSPSLQGWYPEQCLNVEEALRAYTTGAAYASGMEDRLGKLLPGYLADLLILDKNPYACAPEELLAIQPLATMVNGEWVYTLLE